MREERQIEWEAIFFEYPPEMGKIPAGPDIAIPEPLFKPGLGANPGNRQAKLRPGLTGEHFPDPGNQPARA
jgi:hypothetical protein